MRQIAILLAVLGLFACERAQPSAVTPVAEAPPASATLAAILAAQPDEVRARYAHRHPQETLEFFGIAPGMTVVEALPGGGWYSKILMRYLGADGHLVGANYTYSIWNHTTPIWLQFGFFNQAFIERMATWTIDWPRAAQDWGIENGAAVSAFEFGSLPDELEGQADAVLLVRALHHLAHFESAGGFLTTALADVRRVLKPGGVVGIVQHEAHPEMPDDWAGGAHGYLKRQFVIDRMIAAGFEFVGASEVNTNPNDRPTTDDIVWRLPPSLSTSRDDPALQAQMEAIGESHRMTLLFRKP